MKIRKPTTVITIAATIITISASASYAYWTATGSGTGTATVATLKPLEISQDAITGLIPGSIINLSVKVKNTNDFEVAVSNPALQVTGTTDAAHAACVFDQNFKVTPPTINASTLDANEFVSADHGTITMISTSHDQFGCQGATVTMAYVLK